VRFYTEVLELKLTTRFGDHWATIDAGKGLTIGLHPASPKYPSPGTKGAIMLAFEINEDIEEVMRRLRGRGVKFTGPVTQSREGNFVHLEDPDGNEIYGRRSTVPINIRERPRGLSDPSQQLCTARQCWLFSASRVDLPKRICWKPAFGELPGNIA
jgi:predicted enzyme related to lactoylglutathione lyase